MVFLLVAWPVLLGPVPASEKAHGAEKVAGSLAVRDALTVPGRAVRIEARLVHRGLVAETGLGGERLELVVEGKRVATSMTGGDGRAFLEYTPRMRGNYLVTVRLVDSKRVESAEATAILACWERRRPILLVDVAALEEAPKRPPGPLPSLPLDLGRQQSPDPAPDAADELKRLAQFFYNVVYLSRSGRAELGGSEDLRGWLKDHRFPSGLVMTVNPGREALGARIDALRDEGWDNLKAGIGRTREFAEVLVEHRLHAIIIPESDREAEVPKKARTAKDWKEIRKKLQR